MRRLARTAVLSLTVLACLARLRAQQPPAPDAPALIRTADASYLRGDYEAARQSLAAAWDLLQQTPPENPKIADDLLVSVSLCRGAKQFDQAFKLFPSILGTHGRAYGFDSPQVAEDYSRMAQVLMDQKKPEDAAAILDVAMGIRTRLTGPLDISLLPLLDRLGGIEIEQHDYEKA
jgi:tetratricopeptide (TPR) repeat protein